jgi:hypothetical protein
MAGKVSGTDIALAVAISIALDQILHPKHAPDSFPLTYPPGQPTFNQGSGVLTAGLFDVAVTLNNSMDPTKRSMVWAQYTSKSGVQGVLTIFNRTDTGFTVLSTNLADTNSITWFVITPVQ